MKTEIDRVYEVDGIVHVRMKKINDDGTFGYHRTTLEPGADVDKRMSEISAHLQAMGKAKVDAGGIEIVKAVVSRVHTPEVIAKFKEKAQR
jgi:hypothetical protein